MADDVKITFSAEITDLQKGLSEATSAVAATTGALQGGVAQINASFATLGQAYAAGLAQRLDDARTYSDDELAIARAGDRAKTDIALNGVKLQQSQVKEQAQLSQTSHEEELSALLALESQREAIERNHLVFLQSTYKDNATQFASVQRQIDELASQSALRRQEIERNATREIYVEYRRSFEQVGRRPCAKPCRTCCCPSSSPLSRRASAPSPIGRRASRRSRRRRARARPPR